MSLIVAETTKEPRSVASAEILASPWCKEPLEKRESYYYSQADMLAFPIIEGFPCLLPGDGIVASHLANVPAR